MFKVFKIFLEMYNFVIILVVICLCKYVMINLEKKEDVFRIIFCLLNVDILYFKIEGENDSWIIFIMFYYSYRKMNKLKLII